MSADREAPLGWIYLNMYDDKSFEFISKGMIRSKDIYAGNYSIKNDTIYFKYKDSNPDKYNEKLDELIDLEYKSPNWDLSQNIEQAIKENHPHIEALKEYANKISGLDYSHIK